MNRTRKISLITMSVAILLILAGSTISFIENFRVDAKETSYLNTSINNNYEVFNIKTKELKNRLENSTILSKKYYQDIYRENKSSTLELNSLENALKDLSSLGDTLIEQCTKIGEYNANTTKKCVIMNKNYETIQNAFVSMVASYNGNISKYNEWTNTDNGKSYKKLNVYSSNNFFEYVDLDNDGEYLGKLL